MADQQPEFTGAIVLKARSEAETAALAEQLRYYATFGDVFPNRYEGGYAVKGQVYTAAPDGAPDTAVLEAQNRELAARIATMEQHIQELTWQVKHTAMQRNNAEALLALLSTDEHMRLIGRNVVREYPDLWPEGTAIDGDDNPAVSVLAGILLERAARTIETTGPDDTYVTLRAAERCAALVRGLQPTTREEPK